VLVKEAIAEPHRTMCIAEREEDDEIKVLSNSLKDMLRKELLNATKTNEKQTVYGPPETIK